MLYQIYTVYTHNHGFTCNRFNGYGVIVNVRSWFYIMQTGRLGSRVSGFACMYTQLWSHATGRMVVVG